MVSERPRHRVGIGGSLLLTAGFVALTGTAASFVTPDDRKAYDTVDVTCTGPDALKATFRNATVRTTNNYTYIVSDTTDLTLAKSTPCKIKTQGLKP